MKTGIIYGPIRGAEVEAGRVTIKLEKGMSITVMTGLAFGDSLIQIWNDKDRCVWSARCEPRDEGATLPRKVYTDYSKVCHPSKNLKL